MGESHVNAVAWQESPESRPARKKIIRVVLIAGLAGGICLLGFGSFLLNRFVLRHNFDAVSEGQVYRCAQLDAAGLTQMVQEHGIKSILNLRGGVSADGWYQAETNVAHQLGVQHYDYELSASSELTDAQLDELVAMLRNAPKPLLVHCKSGADRTGLVGALYLYSLEGKSAETADHELNMLRGHVPYLFWQDTVAMDHSFWHYVGTHPPASGRKSNPPLTRQDARTSATVPN
jgi:protein tyrosine phosphatase (PTP) superfamily phosphohydrolase (DUF442 family)